MEQEHSVQLKLDDLARVIINNAFDAIAYYIPVRDPDGIIIDFRFVWLNDSAENFLTRKKENYLGKTFLTLFPYDAMNGMFQAFKRTAETGERSEDVYYYELGRHKAWYRNSVIKCDEGIVVYFRDITANKQLELELKENNEHLKKLLQEREMLLKETHHRVKNNLQIISSMLNLQKKGIDDPIYREIFNVSILRLRTMALIHQQLYEDNLFGEVNLYKFSTAIINSVLVVYNSENKKIHINCDFGELIADFDFAVKMGLILNEVVTNSMKYAFKGMQEGEISISLKKEKDLLQFEISDNGIGMAPDFSLQKINSLGLVLVQSLIEDLDGKLEIKGPPGTVFCIYLPGYKADQKIQKIQNEG